jgi:hypothetical protein
MNTKRMAIIDAGVLGLTALGAYGYYRYLKYRKAKRPNPEKANESLEGDVEP